MKNRASSLLILVPGFVWGASFIVTRLVLPFLPPFSLTLFRNLVAVTFLFSLLTYLGGHVHREWREWRSIGIMSLCNTTAFLLTAWGQLHISGGLTTILAATIPFFTIIIAHFVTDDDKINWVRALGIGLGLAGVVILVGAEALTDIGTRLLGQLAILAASCLYGVGSILARPILARQPTEGSSWIPRVRVLTMQSAVAILFLTPIALITDRTWTLEVPLYVVGYVVFLGVGVTTFATMTFYYLIQSVGSTSASMTMYLIPVSGVTLGVLVLGEVVTWTMPIAALLILSGVFIVNRPKRTPPKIA